MTERRDGVLWIASLLLAASAVGVGSLAWSSPDAARCELPREPDALRSLAGADEVRHKPGAEDGDVLLWLEAVWYGGRDSGPRDLAQLVVSEDLSDFVVPPLWMFRTLALPTDEVERRHLVEAPAEGVPVHLRINRAHASPFVVGWIYVLGDRAIESPVGTLIRRAFEHPLDAAPPLTLISADSRLGSLSPELRTSVVLRRLEGLWADWEAVCGS